MAPAVFKEVDGVAVMLNEVGQRNLPDRPARRGRPLLIHVTGLGAMGAEGPMDSALVQTGGQEVSATVTVLSELPGVCRVRMEIPLDTAPGLAVQVTLGQGRGRAKVVTVAHE